MSFRAKGNPNRVNSKKSRCPRTRTNTPTLFQDNSAPLTPSALLAGPSSCATSCVGASSHRAEIKGRKAGKIQSAERSKERMSLFKRGKWYWMVLDG